MNHKFPAVSILKSEPLDRRLSKRLFFYEYFIYMESACVAPWPMPLLNTGTHSGRRTRPGVWASPLGTLTQLESGVLFAKGATAVTRCLGWDSVCVK